MSSSSRFSKPLLTALGEAKALGVRAGADHRYTTVWVVVVEGRVFVRSWNDAPQGWYRAFRNLRRGSIRLGAREIGVNTRFTQSGRLQKAVSRAYAEKYIAKGAQKWVRGFAEPSRERNTLELLPQVAAPRKPADPDV